MRVGRTSILLGFIGVAVSAACGRVELVRPTLAPPDAPVSRPAPAPVHRDTAPRVIAHLPPVDTAAARWAEAFADSLMAEPAEEVTPGPTLALDAYANHDRVDHYVQLFAGEARDRIGERLSRGTRYDDLIRQKLRAGGIPEEFVYLALIESGYDPHAYSPAAAVGMWQFMTTTARGVGMRVDWWIDERRDPVRATDGAITFLNRLREQFGSYYLAAAAYNGGPGRVSRGLSRLAEELSDAEPEDKFFTLASTNLLRAETRNYVPQLIAAAIIGREPTAYGIRVDTQPDLAFDSVAVANLVSVPAVASVCGVDTRDILDLNGHVLRGMAPPSGGDLWMRVPPGCADDFDYRLSALDSASRFGAVRHRAVKGDTPTSLAKKAGVSLAVLRRYNPSLKTAAGSAISAGTEVLLPSADAVRASRDVPDPSIERYGVTAGSVYTVRRGDTLSGIALRNRVSVATIKRLNKIAGDRIYAGQKLRIR